MVGLVVDDNFGALGEGEEVGHLFCVWDMSGVSVLENEVTITAPLSSLARVTYLQSHVCQETHLHVGTSPELMVGWQSKEV
jgi:hypothetical protein